MLFQILSLLKHKGKTQFSIDALDRYMQNSHNQQFTLDTFKAAYDADPKIQNIVRDFDQNTITLTSDDDSGMGPGNDEPQQGSGNKVSQMAKRAVDL